MKEEAGRISCPHAKNDDKPAPAHATDTTTTFSLPSLYYFQPTDASTISS